MERRRSTVVTWAVAAVVVALIVVEPPGPATAGPADVGSLTTPAVSTLRPTPDASWGMWSPRREVRPGDPVDVAYRPLGGGTSVQRTACVALEYQVDGTWTTVTTLPRVSGALTQPCSQSVGHGLGPDRFVLPPDLRPGPHRICQVGAVTETAAPATVCLELLVGES